MRLTATDKDAFVRAVMDDVPEIDYNEIARNKIAAKINELMPPMVKEAMNKHPEWLSTPAYTNTPFHLTGCYIFAPSGFDIAKQHPELWAELIELGNANQKQNLARYELEMKVRGLIRTCSTLKTATERLPEFVKYLPADRDASGTKNLPVANLVSDLIDAGWPKHKEAA